MDEKVERTESEDLGAEVDEAYQRAFDDGDVFEQVEADEVKVNQARIVVAFVGHVSAGKSSLIKALFGFTPSEISPIEGSTEMVNYFGHPEVDNLFIADTPGLADVEQWRAEKTYEAMPIIDIVIFVLERVDERATEEHRRIVQEWGKPCLVVRNKMDDVAPERRSDLLAHVRKYFPGSKVIGCAAGGEPPATARSIEPFGLEQITNWLWEQDLSEAKKLRFTYGLQDKDAAAEKIVNLAAGAAAGVGLIPVPGADIIPLVAIQIGMIRRVNRIYGVQVADEIVQHFLQLLASQVAKSFYRWLIQAGKGLGWFAPPWGPAAVAAVASIVAGATTYALGRGAIAMCKHEIWETFQLEDGISGEVLKAGKIAYEQYSKKQKRITGDEQPQVNPRLNPPA